MLSLFLLQQKALEAAMNDINSSFGKGSVTRLGSAGGALVYVSFLQDGNLICHLSFYFKFIKLLGAESWGIVPGSLVGFYYIVDLITFVLAVKHFPVAV